MQDNIFDIAFEYDGKAHTGSVHPSEKLNEKGTPVSFQVVLDDTPFGNLSFQDCKWTIGDKKPTAIVKQIGKQIEKHFEF